MALSQERKKELNKGIERMIREIRNYIQKNDPNTKKKSGRSGSHGKIFCRLGSKIIQEKNKIPNSTFWSGTLNGADETKYVKNSLEKKAKQFIERCKSINHLMR